MSLLAPRPVLAQPATASAQTRIVARDAMREIFMAIALQLGGARKETAAARIWFRPAAIDALDDAALLVTQAWPAIELAAPG